MKHRPRTCRPSPLPDLWKFRRGPIGIIDKSWIGGRKVLRSRIVRAVVAGMGGIKHGSDFFRDVIVVGIGKIISNEIRPAKISRCLGLIDFIIAARTTGSVPPGIRSHLPPVNMARGLIHAHSPGIATAHAVNFRPRAGRTGGKKVAFGNFISAVGLWTDAKNLSPQISGIRRRFLGIPWFHVGTLIDGGIAFGIAVRMCIVTRGNK